MSSTIRIPMSEPVQSKKRRRLHPIRRVARWLLKKRRVSEEKEVDTQRVCRGPSILHNFLPFLEPLFTIDPKLKFVEDRIIGRAANPHSEDSVKLPSSLNELEVWVKEASPPCHCDECAPKSYRIKNDRTHGCVRHKEHYDDARSKGFSHTSQPSTTPQPGLSLRLYGDYEAMRLVRHHIAWLDHTYLHPSRPKDLPSVSQLTSLLTTWKPNLTAPNLRSSISIPQLQHLFHHLNTVFFFNAVPTHRAALSNGFSWLPENRKDCFGISHFNPIIGTQILLHPQLYRHSSVEPTDADVRLRNRIGTILHEMCHAYLKAYTCRTCVMHDHCVGAQGHGHAWQILAAKIEQVATRLLAGFVDMGRFPSLLHDMQGHGRLPSLHELNVYRFGKVGGDGAGAP